MAEQNKQRRDGEGSPPWGRMKCNLGGGSCGERILVEVRVLKPKNLSVSHASWLGWAVSKGEGSRAFCLALESWAALQHTGASRLLLAFSQCLPSPRLGTELQVHQHLK